MNEEFHGWTIGNDFEEKTVEVLFTDKENKSQLWNMTARNALFLANLLIEKAINLMDAER